MAKITGKQIKSKVREELPRPLVAKPKLPPDGMLSRDELSNLRDLIVVLQKHVERIIRQQADVSKDMAEMRKDIFLTNLAEGMKDKKKLKKRIQSKKNRLLEKCGVKTRKATLTQTDVERIKSRVPMLP